MLALRSDPAVSECLAYDGMACMALVVAPLPGSDDTVATVPRPVTDLDIARLQEWLQLQGLPRIGKDIVHPSRRFARP